MGVVEEVDFTEVHSSDSYRVALQKRESQYYYCHIHYNNYTRNIIIVAVPLSVVRLFRTENYNIIMYFIRTVSKLVLSVYLLRTGSKRSDKTLIDASMMFQTRRSRKRD